MSEIAHLRMFALFIVFVPPIYEAFTGDEDIMTNYGFALVIACMLFCTSIILQKLPK